MSNVIHGRSLLKVVSKAVGLEFQKMRRIIIDIPYDGVVLIYAEMIGESELLEIDYSSLSGYTIKKASDEV